MNEWTSKLPDNIQAVKGRLRKDTVKVHMC